MKWTLTLPECWIGLQDVAPEPGGVPGPSGLLRAGVPQPALSRQLTA